MAEKHLTPTPGVRDLTQEDLDQIVVVHRAAFPDSALTKLGGEAVWRYYEWQIVGPHDAVNIGAFDGKLLIGFCFSGVFRGALGGFLERNRNFLTRRLIVRPWLLFNPLFRERATFAFKRVFQRKRGPKSLATSPVNAPSPGRTRPFGILSIAVHPDYQGSGIAQRMMQICEQAALERGFCEMGLTVHPTNFRAIRFYEKVGWQRISDNNGWSGSMRKSLADATHDRSIIQ